MNSFVLLSLEHIGALALVVLCSRLAFRAGLSRYSERVNLATGLLFAAYGAILQGYRLRDGFQAADDLPLWLCDILFLTVIWCVVKPNRLVLSVTIYWGLAGTLQAMVTPDIQYGFPSQEFVLFFLGHGMIVVAAFFFLGRHQTWWTPDFRSLAEAFGALLAYTLVVGAINLLFGWNYGYLSRKPQGASILDFFGPWPWYVLAGLGLGLILFAAVQRGLALLLRKAAAQPQESS